jgi:hypothetical protein
VIFGIVFSLPNVLPQKTLDALPGWVPHQKLNLGLDLQGGSYLLYEVDTDALRAERLTNMVEDVRTTLRNEQIEFGELGEAGGIVGSASPIRPRWTAVSLLRRSIGAPLAGAIGGRTPRSATRATAARAELRAGGRQGRRRQGRRPVDRDDPSPDRQPGHQGTDDHPPGQQPDRHPGGRRERSREAAAPSSARPPS